MAEKIDGKLWLLRETRLVSGWGAAQLDGLGLVSGSPVAWLDGLGLVSGWRGVCLDERGLVSACAAILAETSPLSSSEKPFALRRDPFRQGTDQCG